MGETRRAHRKSRNGCNECKRRRIKCGEEKPQCYQCARHNITCKYAVSKTAHTERNASACPSASSDIGVRSAEPPTPITTPGQSDPSGRVGSASPENSNGPLFDMKDLSLLHHWSLTTSVSIINAQKLDDMWQQTFPLIAFRHDYVMYSILSLSALHVAYLNPSDKQSSLNDAATYHAKALDGFRRDIDHLSSANCEALFANAILVFFYAFVTFGKLHDPVGDSTGGPTRIARVLGTEWIPLMRGVVVILHAAQEQISAGPLQTLLIIGNWFELQPDPDSDPDDKRLDQIREIWDQGEYAAVYDETLDLLRRCRMWMAQFEQLEINDTSQWGHNRKWAGPFIWVLMVPQQFFALLDQRQPSALILFAYYGATIHALRRFWWIDGCGKSIVDVVNGCLGPYWSRWMEWPKQAVLAV
ncbi:unnamed protein product [Periconia digitata]|uniref:Zn(2)-C6 fungal-type domain-containing protein n=1 Tax=Periconia digitata TaxID=1303443 RepID=A0A9W4XRB7_9PLEO|nr:unnamed protein product [Periconia digitata]